MYVRMYLCMYVRMYVCMYVCMHVAHISKFTSITHTKLSQHPITHLARGCCILGALASVDIL